MQDGIISIGEKIELTKILTVQADIDTQKTYISQLMDIKQDLISIAMPIEGSKVYLLDVGEKFRAYFYTKNGLYECKLLVTDRYKSQNLSIAVCAFLSDLEKYQRRQYFRLECVMSFQYRILTQQEQRLDAAIKNNMIPGDLDRKQAFARLEQLKINNLEGIIIDISGGGARFNSSTLCKKNEEIRMAFSLITSRGIKNFDLSAKVISCGEIPTRRQFYENRVAFTDISNIDREIIVQYIFEEERKRRRKERGL